MIRPAPLRYSPPPREAACLDVETTPAMTAEDARGTFVSAGKAAKAFRSAGRA